MTPWTNYDNDIHILCLRVGNNKPLKLKNIMGKLNYRNLNTLHTKSTMYTIVDMYMRL